MAERRMFAKTIIDSDVFLDMPLSAQALYFHLSMRADDEGFINNPKKIQRMVGASEDDLKLLVVKKFVIPFDSGIVVIKHWKIHNYIRNDRLVETKYQEEKRMLSLKENGAYTLDEETVEITQSSETDMLKIAYQNSTLPYSFAYKIKRAFEGRECPLCGRKMSASYTASTPSIQHNIPISKGGVHELENISVICRSCNSSVQDTETGELNNKEVIEKWDGIIFAEKNNIDWFSTPEILSNFRCQSSVSQVSDKQQSNVSIGKDSIGKDSIVLSNSNELDCQTQDVRRALEAWNELKIYGIKTVIKLKNGTQRYRMLQARIREYGISDVLNAIEKIKISDFLQGKHNGKPWQITFDWFVRPNNFPKVLDGNYDNGGDSNGRTGRNDAENETDPYADEIYRAFYGE